MTQRERGWHRVTPEAEDAKSGWEGQGFLLMAEKGVTIELGFQGLLVAPHKKYFHPFVSALTDLLVQTLTTQSASQTSLVPDAGEKAHAHQAGSEAEATGTWARHLGNT